MWQKNTLQLTWVFLSYYVKNEFVSGCKSIKTNKGMSLCTYTLSDICAPISLSCNVISTEIILVITVFKLWDTKRLTIPQGYCHLSYIYSCTWDGYIMLGGIMTWLLFSSGNWSWHKMWLYVKLQRMDLWWLSSWLHLLITKTQTAGHV